MFDESYKNNLWLKSSRTARRRAFSLAELVVAIGVLLLMFALAGQVFNVTIHSTGQALAITDVRSALRAFEQRLREDLRSVQPGESLIVIQGNPVHAYWHQEGKDADGDALPENGYPHPADPAREDAIGNLVAPRADILMLFTSGTGRSAVPGYRDMTSNLQQIVYGHAEQGEWEYDANDAIYKFAPGPTAFPTSPSIGGTYPQNPLMPGTTPSPVPAEFWHLARRSLLLVPQPVPLPLPAPLLVGFQDERLAQGDFDIYGDFNYDERVLTPNVNAPRHLPLIFDPDNPFSIPDPNAGLQYPYARSRIDVTPPPKKAIEALGHYFLPRCASFKVEWSLDPRSEFVDGRLDGLREVIWFDPGSADPLASLIEAENAPRNSALVRDNLLKLRTQVQRRVNAYPDWDEYSLETRFGGPSYDPTTPWKGPDDRANTVVFRAGAWRMDAAGNARIVPDDIFPAALRITVDLYDSERRLEKPTRHVMIVPVGS